MSRQTWTLVAAIVATGGLLIGCLPPGGGDPTPAPTGDATAAPTGDATAAPTGDATAAPTGDATEAPTEAPTEVPTEVPTTGALSGTVTNATTGDPLAGATVTIDPPVEGLEIITAEDGTYSAELDPADYVVSIEATNFDAAADQTVTIVAGETATADAALAPTDPVVVKVTLEGDQEPGGTVTATVSVEILDGSTVEGYAWEQSNSVAVTIDGASSNTATVTLPAVAVYKALLLTTLVEPPIESEEPFHGGMQDRFQIVGLNPFTLEEVAIVGLDVAVTTSSGIYEAGADIHTHLPWPIANGLQNVPIGKGVLLQGKTQDAYDWALTVPGGSSASLSDATSQNPYFTPDVTGIYSLAVTDTTVDPAVAVTLDISAGTFKGAISGQDADGRPESAGCTGCHNGGFAPDMFTPWAQSGHAEIFTDNFNTSTHYSDACLSCHTVGYDPGVDNGGVDDAEDYDTFLDTFTTDGAHFHADEANWTNALADTPKTAQLANIQCENCHGPNESASHMSGDGRRVDLSSNVCAVCHGEPLRHARFQQWQLSGHANYELAVDEGTSGSCARCHTANGFLAWANLDTPFDADTNVDVDWTEDEIHPQTCVTCHDPHNVGTTTGDGTDATVRIYGDTPLLAAGFTATGVGNGALCMTCHNSRRGLRNDDTWADVGSGDAARSPHGPAQADVLMGQNAYFVEVGTPGSHAGIEDTCVNCHMEATPPPDPLAYSGGGTNHMFTARGDICGECHGFDNADGVQAGVAAKMDELQGLIEEAIVAVIAEQIAAGNTIDVNGVATITDAADVQSIEFGEYHGRQSVDITLADGTVLGPQRLPDLDVLGIADGDTEASVLGELYDFADARLAKAGWNWLIVHNDGSRGVHNVPFANNVLDSAIDALETLAAE